MGHIGARFKNIAFYFLLRPLLSSSSFPRMAGYTTHAHTRRYYYTLLRARTGQRG